MSWSKHYFLVLFLYCHWREEAWMKTAAAVRWCGISESDRSDVSYDPVYDTAHQHLTYASVFSGGPIRLCHFTCAVVHFWQTGRDEIYLSCHGGQWWISVDVFKMTEGAWNYRNVSSERVVGWMYIYSESRGATSGVLSETCVLTQQLRRRRINLIFWHKNCFFSVTVSFSVLAFKKDWKCS